MHMPSTRTKHLKLNETIEQFHIGIPIHLIISTLMVISNRIHVILPSGKLIVIGVEHVGGDMFESVPKGDAIFMKVSLYFI